MPLESLLPNSTINVRDLTISRQEREKPLIFDPQRDLDPEVFTKGLDFIFRYQHQLGEGNLESYDTTLRNNIAGILFAGAILYPEELNRAFLGKDRLFSLLRRDFSKQTAGRQEQIFVKVAFPNKLAKDFSRSIRQMVDSPLEQLDEVNENTLEILALRKLFKPDEQISPELEAKAKEFLKKDLPRKGYFAALTKIISGNSRDILSTAEWQGSFRALNFFHQRINNPNRTLGSLVKGMDLALYLSTAACLHIHSSERIEVTKVGLQLINDSRLPNYSNPQPPLPEARRF